MMLRIVARGLALFVVGESRPASPMLRLDIFRSRSVSAGASTAAFLHGLHTAMFVAAGLAIVGALLGLLVQRGSDVDPTPVVAA